MKQFFKLGKKVIDLEVPSPNPANALLIKTKISIIQKAKSEKSDYVTLIRNSGLKGVARETYIKFFRSRPQPLETLTLGTVIKKAGKFKNLKVGDKVLAKGDCADYIAVQEAQRVRSFADVISSKKPKTERLIWHTPADFSKTLKVSNKPLKKINVGLIGGSEFAKRHILPILDSIPAYNIHAISSSSPLNSKLIAEKFSANYCTTDYKTLLKDQDINLILIANKSNLHTKLISEATKHKKFVYVEKPIAINTNQYSHIKSLKKPQVLVGFNRRYAPFIKKLKQNLKNKPTTIFYKVNSEYIPKTHWINKDAGGRFINEACHMIDLITYLIPKPIKKMKSIRVGKKDNLKIVLTFKDKSQATLIYTTLANPFQPKEKLYVFQKGLSAKITDFKSMKLNKRTYQLPVKNKGHFEQFKKLSRSFPTTNFKEALKSTKLTLDALDKSS